MTNNNQNRDNERSSKHRRSSKKASPSTTTALSMFLLTFAAVATAPQSAAFEMTRPIALAPAAASRPGCFATANSHVASPLQHRRQRRQTSSLVRLNFRGQDDGIPTSASSSPSSPPPASSASTPSPTAKMSGGKWWTSLFSTPPAASPDPEVDDDQQQEAVDEYLEFLDRRYRRLHEDEGTPKKDEKQQPFSAVQWIMNGQSRTASPPPRDSAPTLRQQKDALFVLGVAGLASQKLLQKHQIDHVSEEYHAQQKQQQQMLRDSMGRPPSMAPASPALDAEVVPASTTVAGTSSHHKAVNAMLPLLRLIYVVQHHRRQTARFVSTRLRQASGATLRLVLKSIIKAPAWAGGKKNVVSTLALCYAAFLCLSPVVRAFLAAEGPM